MGSVGDHMDGFGSTYGDMSRPRGDGNVTMVGFRSETNLFLLKRLMWNIRNCGRGCSKRCRTRWASFSDATMPLYLLRRVVRGTWGIMDSAFEDWKSGVGGRSRVRIKKGLVCEVVSLASEKTRRALAESERAVIAWLSIRSWPWNVEWITLVGVGEGFLEPPRLRWRLLRNQERNSTGSDCWVRVKRLEERRAISWSSSCGDTWDLNALGFHSLRTSVPKRIGS